jgi:hypothetical protein
VLKLDFDTVMPGHGVVVEKADMQRFRESTKQLTELVSQMVQQGKSKPDIEGVLRMQCGWQDFHV